MIRFSDFSNRRLGHLARLPLRLLPPGAVMPVLQGPMKGQRWVVGSSTHGCWLGSYEWDKQRLFARTVRRGQTVFDIGANVDLYTLLAARCVGSTGRVVSFEPNPRNLKFLERHVALNRLPNVRIMDVALGGADGEMRFDASGNPSEGHISATGDLRIQVRTLDDLWRSGAVPAAQVLKIDVEGAELDVLTGACEFLSRCHPTIFLATHSPELKETCTTLLERQGYVVTQVDPARGHDGDELLARWTEPAA